MAKVREFEFVTGVETSTIPDPGTPSADTDTISKGYADDTYTPRAHNYGKVTDITALKAIGPADRFDEQVVWVSGKMTFYEFDAASVAVGDDDLVVQPTSGTGRWIKQFSSVAGGASGASGIEALEVKVENEHFDSVAADLDNSVANSFYAAKQTVSGRLLADHTTGTTVYLAWNPIWLNDSDKNTDSTTGWATGNADTANLTTSGTFKIGTASLSFDKTGTAGTNTRIVYDRGSANLSINGNTDLYFWINLPSVTNFSNVECRIEVDAGTNYQTFTTTTDNTGATINGTGWWLVKFDLSTGGSATGTGWDKSKLIRRVAVGVNTTSAAQTYTAILIDSIHFSLYTPTELVQAGNLYVINDTSNVNEITIDSASTRVAGTVTLAASLTQAYSGGTSSELRRNTLSIVGDNGARMENGLSGTIADQQIAVQQAYLNESLSAQNFKAFTDVNTNCIFKVLSVPGSTQITVEDYADQSANIVSGVIIHTFQTKYNADGKKQFINRNLDLTVSSSSWATNVLTINTGTNTGIAIGDYVVMQHVTTKVSLVAVGSAETFVTPTTDDVFLKNYGLLYPNNDKVWGHWNLSQSSGNKLLKGTSGLDLTLTGSLTTNNQFKNGQYATSGWTDANYYTITAAASEPVSGASADCTSVIVSFWFKATAFTGTGRYLVSKNNTAETQGWAFILSGGANTIAVRGDATTISTSAFTPDVWNHVVGVFETVTVNGCFSFFNGVKSATTTLTLTDSATPIYIGRQNAAGSSAAGVQIADVVIWRNSTALTQGQVESIYAKGNHIPLNFGPMVKYRYSQNSLTGQKLSLYNKLSRTTDLATPFISATGIIKS